MNLPADRRDSIRPAPPGRGSGWEVLRVFLKLGLSSFGGPVAHLGYFRTEFVQRRRWLDDRHYSDLVALCQFLPGPASSQVGMALGLQRAGWGGALAAWAGFTLPSALLLMLFAQGVQAGNVLAATGVLHGLAIVAVAVVAQAVWGMYRTLCPDLSRTAIAVAAALLVLALPTAAGQLGAIVLGALAGRWGLRLPVPATAAPTAPPTAPPSAPAVSRRTGALLLALCTLLLLLLPWLAAASASPWLQAVAVVYQAGALVFGGGHVVLPLLQAGVVAPGWVADDVFLAGYGAAQAVPGPLFSFGAYLGAVMPAPLGGWAGGLVLLVAIFLPGFLLVAGALPFWDTLRRRPGAQRAMAGTHAAVVGLLAAALVDPLWTHAIRGPADAALALAAFGLLVGARLPPVAVVLLAALAGAALRP